MGGARHGRFYPSALIVSASGQDVEPWVKPQKRRPKPHRKCPSYPTQYSLSHTKTALR